MTARRARPALRDGHCCPVFTPAQIRRGLDSGRFRITAIGMERLCSRCAQYWPLDTEFWQWTPRKSGGVHNYCKACDRERRDGRKPYKDRRAEVCHAG
ncbi:hypothetical protein [Thioalkalivibrio sp. ALMg9]|uniref:hypothetical protein n=1 Tax=Thioalkalivibrio sp. ALMg9 TaxID=1266912 RepID=UPI0003728545|nr:hypothetical protein [Thioalkalivibrio sp. ALMg9]